MPGRGAGATGSAVGEVCFNTAMTGYQEILTDPSYAGQIITFTFPHIGNVGTNTEDIETSNMAASSGVRGVVVRASVTDPANYRAEQHLDVWLRSRGIVGISGLDTRALTARIREIYEAVDELILEYTPAAMSVEDVFQGKNVRSALTLGHARGAILLAAALRELEVAEYTPREIKRAVAGTGGATKDQIAYMVQRHLRLAAMPKPSDAADGVAAALCHGLTGRLPNESGPKLVVS